MVSVRRSPMATVYNRKYLVPATLEEAKMATAKNIFLFLWLVFVWIPVWGQGKNAASTIPPVVDPPRVTVPGSNSASQPVDPKTYLIGPEDILRIEVYRDQDMTRVVNVRPDGKITMPLINDIQAEGLTPERLTAG